MATPPKEFPRRGMNFGSSYLPEARSYADPTPICRLGPTIQRAAIQPRCSSSQPLSAVPDQASTQRAWLLHAHAHRHSLRRRDSRAPLLVPRLPAHCLSTAGVHLALPAVEPDGDGAVPPRPSARRTNAASRSENRAASHALPARPVLGSPLPRAGPSAVRRAGRADSTRLPRPTSSTAP